MSKKKMVYSIILLFLVGSILFIYNEFNGNPLSKWYAKRTVDNYLAEHYEDKTFRIDEGFYDFKFKEYAFDVIEIGSTSETSNTPETYYFTVRGWFKPTVMIDGIYTENLDYEAMERLSQEAASDIQSILLENNVSSVHSVDVQLEILKGEYSSEQPWSKQMELEKPFSMHMFLDVTNREKEQFYEDVKSIQTILNKEGYLYDSVTINGNIIEGNRKDESGYVKYYVSFTPETEIEMESIKEFSE
ncbi:hypothetical protein [Bacillus alkalicellulosilyticus]|uniref:YfjL-like protein n=1 Tax=Alkalihalobacterium alkalicellulosilyticum TaxID=1912214 RepID=UPI000995E4DC|nr:hypothetical protein [Bacillus alkalicellulosilyticus]